jgi:hypothetical protein
MKRPPTKYRSGFEARIAARLPNGTQYEPVGIPYVLPHRYFPDFIVPNGIFLETKGRFPPADRKKMLAVKAQNPDLDIRMVFQNPYLTLTKRSKTTYAAWCDKHGIAWCNGASIPADWLK